MTPLAHRVVKEITLPLGERNTYIGHSEIPEWLTGAHCFEITDVIPLVNQIADRFRAEGFDGKFAFLPAQKTFIEFVTETNGDFTKQRIGWLLEDIGDDGMRVSCISRATTPQGIESFYVANKREIQSEDDVPAEPYWVYLSQGREFQSEEEKRAAIIEMAEHGFYTNLIDPFRLFAALALINTPRLIGRKQNMPHRGLEKSLARANNQVGRFPLRAWTELKLSVADIGRSAGDSVHEAHLTGEKCLHFCRAHLRVRSGRLERVSAHWRGNPALGIKRTKYAVTA